MGLSKELFLEISNEINDLIFILNPEFKIEFINEKVHSKLLGYSNEDLINKKIKNLENEIL